MLIDKGECVALKHCIVFIGYSNGKNNIDENIDEYNSSKKSKLLIVFDDLLNNKKLQPIVVELFNTGRKLNIFYVFIAQSQFAVPRNIR